MKINAAAISSSLIIPIIEHLCENMSIIINTSNFPQSTCQLLKEVINESLTSEDYDVMYQKLKEKNLKGVKLAKKEYSKTHKTKDYMNCDEMFYMEYGNKMLDDGNKVIESLHALRKLFDKQIDFIRSILNQKNLQNDFEKIISLTGKSDKYLGLIKNILIAHLQAESEKLLSLIVSEEEATARITPFLVVKAK